MIMESQVWDQIKDETDFLSIRAEDFDKGINLTLFSFLLQEKNNKTHWGCSDHCLYLYCYFHNVAVDMASGLLQVLVELFIEFTRVACSYSVSHNRVQVLSIPVLLLACSQDWTCNLQMIVYGTNANKCYAMCPAEEGRRTYRPKRCGNNNKNEDNSPKTLNDKNHQASSQKFRQL